MNKNQESFPENWIVTSLKALDSALEEISISGWICGKR